MTEQQQKAEKALQDLAIAVKSNFKKLQESEIIGRIMLISGRDFSQALKGYEILVQKK